MSKCSERVWEFCVQQQNSQTPSSWRHHNHFRTLKSQFPNTLSERKTRSWPMWLLIVMIAAYGCNKSKPVEPLALKTEPSTDQSDQSVEPPRSTQPVAAQPEVSVAPPIAPDPVELVVDGDLVEPQVLLSEAHQQTCRAKIGDVAADVTVTDINGTNHQLARLLSEQLTVLLFWTEESAASLEQFRRLPVDVLAAFADKGVKVIAVNVGGEVARVRELTGDAADKITSLVDEDGDLFGQFATSISPRTYVLDKNGTILWFDIEYSQSTQRALTDALTYFLVNASS